MDDRYQSGLSGFRVCLRQALVSTAILTALDYTTQAGFKNPPYNLEYIEKKRKRDCVKKIKSKK